VGVGIMDSAEAIINCNPRLILYRTHTHTHTLSQGRVDESAAEMDSLMQMPEIKFGAGALGGQIPVQEVDPFKNGTYVYVREYACTCFCTYCALRVRYSDF
jgi:hypothetical protein